MTVLELFCLSAVCESHELVTKANAENRNAKLLYLLYVFDYLNILGRISGAVREHDSVRSKFLYLLGCCISRNYDDLAAALYKFLAYIALIAEIKKHNAELRILIGICKSFRICNALYCVFNFKSAYFFKKLVLFCVNVLCCDNAVHNANLTNYSCKASGINIVYTDYVVLGEKIVYVSLTAEI